MVINGGLFSSMLMISSIIVLAIFFIFIAEGNNYASAIHHSQLNKPSTALSSATSGGGRSRPFSNNAASFAAAQFHFQPIGNEIRRRSITRRTLRKKNNNGAKRSWKTAKGSSGKRFSKARNDIITMGTTSIAPQPAAGKDTIRVEGGGGGMLLDAGHWGVGGVFLGPGEGAALDGGAGGGGMTAKEHKIVHLTSRPTQLYYYEDGVDPAAETGEEGTIEMGKGQVCRVKVSAREIFYIAYDDVGASSRSLIELFFHCSQYWAWCCGVDCCQLDPTLLFIIVCAFVISLAIAVHCCLRSRIGRRFCVDRLFHRRRKRTITRANAQRRKRSSSSGSAAAGGKQQQQDQPTATAGGLPRNILLLQREKGGGGGHKRLTRIMGGSGKTKKKKSAAGIPQIVITEASSCCEEATSSHQRSQDDDDEGIDDIVDEEEEEDEDEDE